MGSVQWLWLFRTIVLYTYLCALTIRKIYPELLYSRCAVWNDLYTDFPGVIYTLTLLIPNRYWSCLVIMYTVDFYSYTGITCLLFVADNTSCSHIGHWMLLVCDWPSISVLKCTKIFYLLIHYMWYCQLQYSCYWITYITYQTSTWLYRLLVHFIKILFTMFLSGCTGVCLVIFVLLSLATGPLFMINTV